MFLMEGLLGESRQQHILILTRKLQSSPWVRRRCWRVFHRRQPDIPLLELIPNSPKQGSRQYCGEWWRTDTSCRRAQKPQKVRLSNFQNREQSERLILLCGLKSSWLINTERVLLNEGA